MTKSFLPILSAMAVLLLASCQGPSSASSSSSASSQKSESSESSLTSSEASSSSSAAESSSSASSSEESSHVDPAPESKLSLYKADSVFSFTSIRGSGSSPLATYHHADLGDAPYVELEQYVNALAENIIIPGIKYEKLAEHLYGISKNGAIFATFNPETDKFIIKNLDFALAMGDTRNHDLGQDPAIPSDTPDVAVHGSARSNLIGSIQDEVIDMAKYHFDMVEENGKLYFPYQPVSSTLTRNNAYDLLYNGSDFFINSSLNAPLATILPGAATSCYATKDRFMYADALYEKVDPVGEEKYRFHSESAGKAFSFKENGVLELVQVTSKTDAGTAVASGSTLSYEEGADGLYIKFVSDLNPQYISEARIPNFETYFDAKKRTNSIAAHSLDILRYQFDNLYGLKPQLFEKTGTSSFDGLIDKLNLRNRLLSIDSFDYDEALCEFLMGTVDDCHTTYTARSLFSGLPKAGAKELANEKTGPRRNGLFEKMDTYSEMRKKTLEDGQSALGLFFEGETAVIRFDEFAEGAGKVLTAKGGWAPTAPDIATAFATSTTEGLYLSIEEIKKHSEVKNVVFDVTVNGGGQVLTVPYLSAVWTDDPHIMTQDAATGTIRDYHYNVDLNRNGIFGEPEDTLKGQYEFFVLTSDFSFSCGNEFPTLAYTDGIKVIGKQSGGGACPVSTMCDGSGTIYNSSMPRYFVYPDGEGGYASNETGAPILPGRELEPESWYDLAKLNTFCNNLREN